MATWMRSHQPFFVGSLILRCCMPHAAMRLLLKQSIQVYPTERKLPIIDRLGTRQDDAKTLSSTALNSTPVALRRLP